MKTLQISDPRELKAANRGLLFGAAAVTVVLWASAFVVIRGVGDHYSPGSMALLRMAVGSLALGVIVSLTGVRLPRRQDLPVIVVWGVGWFSLYNLALNRAELGIDAGTAAMLVSLAPLVVLLIGGLALGEGFPKPIAIGTPVAFLGVVLIAGVSWSGRAAVGGVALALLAAGLYAGATLLQKRLLRTIDGATLTWLGAMAGVIALLPSTGQLVGDIRSAPLSATALVIYLGIFPTAIAFTTWAFVLSRASAAKTATTTYLVPAIALILSWVVLDEVPTPVMLLGGAICLLGVFITRLPSRRRNDPGEHDDAGELKGRM